MMSLSTIYKRTLKAAVCEKPGKLFSVNKLSLICWIKAFGVLLNKRSKCLHTLMWRVSLCTNSHGPSGPGRWLGRGPRGTGQHEEPWKERQTEEPKETQRSLWIQWNSSPPPRLLWEASGACGESEVRRGLSGTKLQIHMICLAKRVKEKWIKAW